MPVSSAEVARQKQKSQQEIEGVKAVLLEILKKDPSLLFRKPELVEGFCTIMRARLSWWQKLTLSSLALNKDNVNVVLLVSRALAFLLKEKKVEQSGEGLYRLTNHAV